MNEENFSLLTENLKELGFSEYPYLIDTLKSYIVKREREFKISAEATFNKDSQMSAILYFSRAIESDIYWFHKFDARLSYPNNFGEDRAYTFLTRRWGVTFKEAFNLLDGRSVYKNLHDLDGTAYNAWIQFNFKKLNVCNHYTMLEFKDGYGYDLEKVLKTYPIEELKNLSFKAALIKSLKMGNRQLATFVTRKNKIEKLFIEASPSLKIIKICSVTRHAYLKRAE